MGRDPVLLVTGAGGQVGRALQALFPGGRFATHGDLDITDPSSVDAAARGVDFIAHCAALTDVQRCEAEPDQAENVNAQGTLNVVAAAQEQRARVIFLSTDYVFDGSKNDCYSEEDSPHPLNVYGASKLRAENHVARAGGTIIRTSWVYGNGRNFVATILRAAKTRSQLDVVDDQVGRPTSADDLAHAILHVIEHPYEGIVHISGDGPPASWADVAERALTAASSPTRIRRVGSAEYDRGARPPVVSRPAHSVLCLTRASGLGFRLRDWRTSVDEYAKGIG